MNLIQLEIERHKRMIRVLENANYKSQSDEINCKKAIEEIKESLELLINQK